MTELWGQGLQVLRTEEGGMVEMDRGRREVGGLGRGLSAWGRGRWDGALSSHLLEISPSLRPHPHTPPAWLATPPQLAGKRSQPYPPHKPIAYRCSRERGGGLKGERVERGCREGKLKEGGEIQGRERGRCCGQVRKPVKMGRQLEREKRHKNRSPPLL